jgi:hypothetical protein
MSEDQQATIMERTMNNRTLHVAVMNPIKATLCQETANWQGYNGCNARTARGDICQSWDRQLPHAHMFSPVPVIDPYTLLVKVSGKEAEYNQVLVSKNFCRNPDGRQPGSALANPYSTAAIWCYTNKAEKRWDYCQPRVR